MNHIERTFLLSGDRTTTVMKLKYCFIWIHWRKIGLDFWRPALYLMKCFPTRDYVFKEERRPGLRLQQHKRTFCGSVMEEIYINTHINIYIYCNFMRSSGRNIMAPPPLPAD